MTPKRIWKERDCTSTIPIFSLSHGTSASAFEEIAMVNSYICYCDIQDKIPLLEYKRRVTQGLITMSKVPSKKKGRPRSDAGEISELPPPKKRKIILNSICSKIIAVWFCFRTIHWEFIKITKMFDFNIWNFVQPSPKLNIKDKYVAKKVKDLMQPFILSDDVIFHIKDAFSKEIISGLMYPDDSSMSITFLKDRFCGEEEGKSVSLCIHSHLFTITLIKLKSGRIYQIEKRDYPIDTNIFKKPHIKVYETFCDCIKSFFTEFHLDGEMISAGFCTDLFMVQFNLDTAFIPHFVKDSNYNTSQRDIKSSFERVLCKSIYQGDKESFMLNTAGFKEATEGISELDRIYESCYFDARIIGIENIPGLKIDLDICHEILEKFKKCMSEAGKSTQKVELHITHSGVNIEDIVYKKLLYHHPLRKISHVIQDFSDSHIFGYVCGDSYEGYDFFGFKADKKSPQLLAILRNIFHTELLRKEKKQLDVQASKVSLKLMNFLDLARNLKAKEQEIPAILKKRIKLVEDIRWWLEGCSDDIMPSVDEDEELELNVQYQDLYHTAYQLKLEEIQKIEEAKKQEEIRKKRHHRRKKKDTSGEMSAKKLPEETSDSKQKKATDIIGRCLEIFKNCLEVKKKESEVLEQEMLSLTSKALSQDKLQEAINKLKEICAMYYDERVKEIKTLSQELEFLETMEDSEIKNIKTEVPHVSVGPKQHLSAVKKTIKQNIFQDISLDVSPVFESDSKLSRKIARCKEYFLVALKIRKEEIDEINYIITFLHHSKNIMEPERLNAISNCRKLLVRAGKMYLMQVDDIELILRKLRNLEKSVLYMIPDAIKYCYNICVHALKRRKTSAEGIQQILSELPISSSLMMSHSYLCQELYLRMKEMNEKEIGDIQTAILGLQGRETATEFDVLNVCHDLYNTTIKMRKKEFDNLLLNLDVLEVDTLVHDDDDVFNLIETCKDMCLTSAAIREKEIGILELEMKSDATKHILEKQGTDVVVTLRDLFYSAIELEKRECEQILGTTNDIFQNFDNNKLQVLPVAYTFKDLFEVVSKKLKEEKNIKFSNASSAKNPCLSTSLKEFLLMAFKLKQKEVEIPLPELKRNLEIILLNMIGEVNEKGKEKIMENHRHYQAIKIVESWREIFLIAAKMRHEEVERVSSSKKAEIEEEADLKIFKNDEIRFEDNEIYQLTTFWKKVFAAVVEMKKTENKGLKQLLELSRAADSNKNQSKGPGVSIDEENEYFEDVIDNLQKEEDTFQSKALNAVDTCKQILAIAIEKESKNLEEREHEMRPILSMEYDEENVQSFESEVTTALDKSKQLSLSFAETVKEQISTIKNCLETLNDIKENKKAMISSAKESCKQFLSALHMQEEKEVEEIDNGIKALDKYFEELIAKSLQKLRPFTDLLVDVISKEDVSLVSDIISEDQDTERIGNEKAENDQKATEYPKLSREEIQTLLLEIDQEQSIEGEGEGNERRKALKRYESLREIFNLARDMRKEDLENIETELQKLEVPEKKKMKSKEKTEKALQMIASCEYIYTSGLKFRQPEIKSILQEIGKMSIAEPKQLLEFESADIANGCRKLFTSTIEFRQKNLAMMKSQVEILQEKEKVLNSFKDFAPEIAASIKYEALTTCKDLVLSSVDSKMKEIDDFIGYMKILDDYEHKIEMHLLQLDPETQKTVFTKLEKAKDTVATCKTLCENAFEKTKKEVKDADEELQKLKGVLESAKISPVLAICTQVLNSSIGKKQYEIGEIEQDLEVVQKQFALIAQSFLGTLIVRPALSFESEVHPQCYLRPSHKLF
ncbi:uncharacterized protein LOC118192777 [Stegodyphus dumicola]|uniref:uncharacterized protein LOC118192777 n=1 Tax=Stegodyphus dumicola TaxID=202533 RepID=UPI0015ADACEF|nr:uncharacterized protein LOC118192777 [Stegodyphus dumicola]